MVNGIRLHKQEIDERELMGEKNDCTVRAIMEVMEVPYMTAYGIMIGAGRKRGKGTRQNGRDLFDSLSTKSYTRPGMIVENYIKYIAFEGKWIIAIRGHVFAVIDGVVKDQWPKGNLNCHVVQAWRF